jgi:hypothetical protein
MLTDPSIYEEFKTKPTLSELMQVVLQATLRATGHRWEGF